MMAEITGEQLYDNNVLRNRLLYLTIFTDFYMPVIQVTHLPSATAQHGVVAASKFKIMHVEEGF